MTAFNPARIYKKQLGKLMFEVDSSLMFKLRKARCEDSIWIFVLNNPSFPKPIFVSQYDLEDSQKDNTYLKEYLRNVLGR